jgi:uncharacterized protein (UPF0179 family)
VTVIGHRLAREGRVFRYDGYQPECDPCPLTDVCHQLDEGRFYEVTEVRDTTHSDVCTVFDGDVQVVEVEERPLKMNIPASATRGTAKGHDWEPCGVPCPYKQHCDPPGLERGDEVELVDVDDEPVVCKVGRDLRLAWVDPTD